MCCKAPDYEEWLESMTKEIKELDKMPVGCWQIVNLTSSPPGAKLTNCRCFYKLKSRDGLYDALLLWAINKKKGVIILKAFTHPLALYHSSRACTHSRS